MVRLRWLGLLGLLGLLGACKGIPKPENPTAAIKQAEAYLRENKPDAARAVLNHFDAEAFVGDQGAQRDLLVGRAYYQLDDCWKAYKETKKFSEEYPSFPTDQISKLHYNCGVKLLHSDGGFWIFYNDRDRGKTVLREFLVRYPYSPMTSEVLHQLGNAAFEDGDYDLAQERYQKLITEHKVSEWVYLASFRVAMCYFYRLQGPQYDLGEMTQARNELRDFLATPGEQPKMTSQARQALFIVTKWMAERQLLIAAYYGKIGNKQARIDYLTIAAERFPDTDAGRRARKQLDRESGITPRLEQPGRPKPDSQPAKRDKEPSKS